MVSRLSVQELDVAYNGTPAVRNVSFTVEPGEVVAMLGPNGAAKTTTLLGIVNALREVEGSVFLDGVDVSKQSTEQRARQGLVLVPDDRGIFHQLTVAENLRLSAARGNGKALIKQAMDAFPRLQDKVTMRAGLLSGGEQQMLAVAKGLVMAPKMLMIDELSMGLAPLIVRSIFDSIRTLARQTGTSVLLVEQHVEVALTYADRGLVLNRGQLVLQGPAGDLVHDRALLESAYLGAAADQHFISTA
ncbi:ABC transporter ATP-binding protein [Nocardioides sp. GCM10030258]|uniref:ABC transporter ATP-binding protein n=1 Tax=unclassified Nocardioides TaxID=2615069 RepID=UPI0036094E2A